MFSLFNKKQDNKGTWHKVSDLCAGLEVAVPSVDGNVEWDEIVSIKPVGKEQVYDIEVEGTHNFVGNDIFAHNTYVLKSGDLTADAPDEVLTADKAGVDLAKLATHTLRDVQDLVAEFAAEDVKLVSLETRVEALESGAIGTSSTTGNFGTGTLASAFNSFGILIQNGIAQFNTLVFRQLVASKDADGTSSAGSVSIITGNTVAEIANSLVSPSTKIFVTFNSQITGSWWVSDKKDGSFRVILSAAQTTDVSFDYFLVQTEGQIATSSPMQLTGNSQQSTGNANDHAAPTITMLGDNPAHVSLHDYFVEPGVSAVDAVDGAIVIVTYINGVQAEISSTTIDTSSPTTYTITYKATDAAGNMATASRSVIVGNATGNTISNDQFTIHNENTGDTVAPVAPVVTLVGDAAMQINVNDAFTDPGASAADDVDGPLTPVVTGSVDATTAGVYTLTYTATDTAGNHGSASRVVTVVAQ